MKPTNIAIITITLACLLSSGCASQSPDPQPELRTYDSGGSSGGDAGWDGSTTGADGSYTAGDGSTTADAGWDGSTAGGDGSYTAGDGTTTDGDGATTGPEYFSVWGSGDGFSDSSWGEAYDDGEWAFIENVVAECTNAGGGLYDYWVWGVAWSRSSTIRVTFYDGDTAVSVNVYPVGGSGFSPAEAEDDYQTNEQELINEERAVLEDNGTTITSWTIYYIGTNYGTYVEGWGDCIAN